MNLQEEIRKEMRKYCEDGFDEAYAALEDGMRQRGHSPDIIHRLLQEDDYVWRRSATVLVTRVYAALEKAGLKLIDITPEQLIGYAIESMKELYETRQARNSN